MQSKHFYRFFSVIILMMACLAVKAASVDIPTATNSYISWSNATGSNFNVENNGANVGSTGKNTQLSFTIHNTLLQDYLLTFKTGTKNAAEMKMTLTDEQQQVVIERQVTIENTNSWTPSVLHNYVIEQLKEGTYTLKFAVTKTTGSYAGNWGDLAFYPLDVVETIPGQLDISKGAYGGGAVNEGPNVGYIKDGATASYLFLNKQVGVYSLQMDVARYGSGGLMEIQVKDAESGVIEGGTKYTIPADASSSYTPVSICIPGEIGKGLRQLSFAFSNGSGYICNYRNVEMKYLAAHHAAINGISVIGQQVDKGDDTDWLCNIPADNNDATTTFRIEKVYCSLGVTAKDEQGNDITVNDNGDGTFTLPTPQQGSVALVDIEVIPDTEMGAVASKTHYTLRIFHIGDISVTKVTVDGEEVNLAEQLNQPPYTAILSDMIFTHIPIVSAQFIDGTTTTGTPEYHGNEVVYTLQKQMGEQQRIYQLTVQGIHVYEKTTNDETVVLKYTGAGVKNGSWSNGTYSISGIGDGWENSSFKMGEGQYTISMPVDERVKQVVFKDFNANYNGGTLTGLSSQGATVWIPSKHDYQESDATMYDLIINLDNHQPGTPIVFSLQGGGQPVAWFELTIDHIAVNTPPVLKSYTKTPTTNKNHCVVEMTFDREMKDTKATIAGQTVEAEGGSSILRFAIWNLNYQSKNTLTLAPGAASDLYGNTNTDPITVDIEVGEKAKVEKAGFDFVVSNLAEWKSAIKSVNSSNTSPNAKRKVIFVRNGDYDFGAEEQNLKAYNVSIIGESRDGVILHGNRDGISNPVLNINNTGGNYLQDISVRNDKDFGKSRSGVGVAISGGKKAIFKNVAMMSQQDTQVTGESGYYIGCQIYGAVDYICGGGNHFYDQCELIMTNPGPITAPATSPMLKWGYVFQHCTVNAYPGFNAEGNYDLGRPWQNEPRAYFLHTKMNVKPSAAGWRSMSQLPTHFYEYKSVDKNGNEIDLSKRTNSPTSTNKYTPVLTDEEAARFTVENVLGGIDSWLPTEEAFTTAAPQVTANGNTLSWPEVEDARCYVILRDGQYVANQTATSFAATTPGTYTIFATNPNGGMGEGAEIQVGKGNDDDQRTEKTPAFPGAEGYGRYVTGGRGGAVYHVTNLNDSGKGSLRWACQQSGTRTIVFDVSGTIHLKSQLKLSHGNVTIAGQTAPSDGICIADWDFVIAAPNVILRYLRFRPGDTSEGEPDGLCGYDGKNIMVDHCSISWSVDECCSVYGNEHMTVQWSIISQSLRNSTHVKKAHGYGGNWGGKGATYHHNLLAHHDSRTPRLANRPMYVQKDTTDYRNNVIYNWAGNGCYGGEGMKANIVNCYYQPGPGTMQSKSGRNATRIAGLGISTNESDGSYMIWGKYFIDGNVNSKYSSVTNDNWGVGVYPHIDHSLPNYNKVTEDTIRLKEPLSFMYVTTHTAEDAYEKVLQYAGASLHRDIVDELVISDTRSNKATYTGKGDGDVYGIIDTPYDLRPADAADDWNPWPTLVGQDAPADTDGDGIPDEWEIGHGLDSSDASDGNLLNEEGYTMLEVYMNSLVAHITEAQNEGGHPEGYVEYKTEEDISGAINIPTEKLNLEKAEIITEPSGKQAAKVLNDTFDSFSHGDQASFLLNCKEAGTYHFSFQAATKRSDFKLNFLLTDKKSGRIEANKTMSISNTGDWQSYRDYGFNTAAMEEGLKQLVITWQSSQGQYTGNVKDIAVTLLQDPDNMPHVDTATDSSADIYDLSGRKVGLKNKDCLQKGIYIKNGKKILKL